MKYQYDNEMTVYDLANLMMGQFESFRNVMDQRFQQVDIRFEQVDARFEQVDARFEQVGARFEQIDRRFEQIDRRLEQFDEKIDSLKENYGAKIDILDHRTMVIKRTLQDELDTKVSF